jgi:hypothetical protein
MTRQAHVMDAQTLASGLNPQGGAPERPPRSRLAELGSVLEQGCARIDRLDAALEKLASSALTVTELGRRVDALRDDGRRRLERLRAEALKRMDEAPRTVVSAATGVARNGLRTLSSELHALAKRLDGSDAKPSGDGGASA